MASVKGHVAIMAHNLYVIYDIPIHALVPLVGHIIFSWVLHRQRVINCNIALHTPA